MAKNDWVCQQAHDGCPVGTLLSTPMYYNWFMHQYELIMARFMGLYESMYTNGILDLHGDLYTESITLFGRKITVDDFGTPKMRTVWICYLSMHLDRLRIPADFTQKGGSHE